MQNGRVQREDLIAIHCLADYRLFKRALAIPAWQPIRWSAAWPASSGYAPILDLKRRPREQPRQITKSDRDLCCQLRLQTSRRIGL